MSRLVNRRVVLAARPRGEPATGDLRLEEAPVPEPGEGQVLLRTVLLSLDPYMRLRMDEGPSYAPPVGIGVRPADRTGGAGDAGGTHHILPRRPTQALCTPEAIRRRAPLRLRRVVRMRHGGARCCAAEKRKRAHTAARHDLTGRMEPRLAPCRVGLV